MAKASMRYITSLKKLGKASRNDSHEYAQVMREFEYVQQQSFQLKLDGREIVNREGN